MSSHDDAFDALMEFLTSCSAEGDFETVDRFVELDLSLSQVKMLFVLAHAAEPLAINALAERVRLSFAAAGRVVDALVTAGLAERHESPADRRVKLVTVTAAGRTATDAHIDAHKAVMRDHVARLTAAEADRLAAALHPLLSSRTTEQETPA
jgi:DNA-binding MarR family transcriptional regulator